LKSFDPRQGDPGLRQGVVGRAINEMCKVTSHPTLKKKKRYQAVLIIQNDLSGRMEGSRLVPSENVVVINLRCAAKRIKGKQNSVASLGGPSGLTGASYPTRICQLGRVFHYGWEGRFSESRELANAVGGTRKSGRY